MGHSGSPQMCGKSEYSLLSVSLARNELIHDRVLKNVRRQHTLIRNKVMAYVLIKKIAIRLKVITFRM
jgi:hypothetical protein